MLHSTDHPSIIRPLRPIGGINHEPNFTRAEKRRYDRWATPLTCAAVALASWIPEIDTAAVVEFFECPKVQTAVAEFQRDMWEGQDATVSSQVLTVPDFMQAARYFEHDNGSQSSHGSRDFSIYGSQDSEPSSAPAAPSPLSHSKHINNFMNRIYDWVIEDGIGLKIKPYFSTKFLIPILAGTLASYMYVCNSNVIQGTGSVDDLSTFWPQEQLPVYLEWRARHGREDPEAPRRLLYLSFENLRSYRRHRDGSFAGWIQILMTELLSRHAHVD
ncbi:hypothetical protein F5Y11DRAFT_215873 [Daldinia sp. FL1419]|nr:hypothetical protein F5Y11DRAFT_215873 [Daldinia sp. FL1419]